MINLWFILFAASHVACLLLGMYVSYRRANGSAPLPGIGEMFGAAQDAPDKNPDDPTQRERKL